MNAAGCFAPGCSIPVMSTDTATYHVLEPTGRGTRDTVVEILDDQPDHGPITHDAHGRTLVRATPKEQ